MNVKIAEDSITFKISEEELNALLAGRVLEENILIGGSRFSMVINPHAGETPLNLVWDSRASRLTLHATQNDIGRLSDMGKSREGLSARNGGLAIFLQVDIRQDSRSGKRQP